MPAPEPVVIFERFCVLMGRGDLEGLKRIYSPSSFYYDALAGKLIGVEQIAPYVASIGDYFDSLEIEVTNAFTLNDHAALQWIQTLVRDGVKLVTHGSTFLNARDDVIHKHVDYFTLGLTDRAKELRTHLALP